jgi:type IV pilus assembly protein PilW
MRKNQRGLSLVELMIAIGLGLFLSWGAVQAFLAGKRTYTMQQAVSRIQENGRLAQEFLSYDIRNAGFTGCGSSSFLGGKPALSGCSKGVSMLMGAQVTTGAADEWMATGEEYRFGASVFGTNNVAADGTGGMSLITPLNPVPVAGTDILVVRTALNLGLTSTDVTPVATAATVNTQNLGSTGTGCYSGLCPGDYVVESDCSRAKIFKITALTVSGTTLTITHGSSALAGGNACTNWGSGATPDTYTFKQGSTLMKLDTAIYYIANNPAGRPALYRRLLGDAGTSQELLEGVENMQLQYGLDTNNDGQVDSFVTADAVSRAQWNNWVDTDRDGVLLSDKEEQRIRSVRYSLLVRSEDTVLDAPQIYTYNGTATTATDRRLHQIFTGSVAIRSRLQ